SAEIERSALSVERSTFAWFLVEKDRGSGNTKGKRSGKIVFKFAALWWLCQPRRGLHMSIRTFFRVAPFLAVLIAGFTALDAATSRRNERRQSGSGESPDHENRHRSRARLYHSTERLLQHTGRPQNCRGRAILSWAGGAA